MIEQAQKLLEQDIIEPSMSPWSSPVILVIKKDGSIRFVIDYRKVNELTKGYVYELPLINDCLRSLSGFKIFTVLDALSGYHQLLVRECDREVTSFAVPGFGSFQFKKMPFGVKNGPATWNALMDRALGSLKFSSSLFYMDDLLIGGKTFEEMMNKLKLVLNALKRQK